MTAAVTLTATGLVVAGCGGGTATTDAEASASTTPSASASESTSPSQPQSESGLATASPSGGAAGLVVMTAGSQFGTILVDRRGQAIYLFDKESTRRAECYRECAGAWPPVLTHGSPQAAGAVRSQLLGTSLRADGSTQVTYAGHPLYYYAHEGPREVLCHNVTEFGGRWLVVTPAGTPAA